MQTEEEGIPTSIRISQRRNTVIAGVFNNHESRRWKRYRRARLVINRNANYRRRIWCTIYPNTKGHRWFRLVLLINFYQGVGSFRIFLRRPWWLVVYIQAVIAWRMNKAEYDILLCAMIATNNGLSSTYNNEVYGEVQTLRQFWLIMGPQGSVYINFDWRTGLQLTRNDPEQLTRWLIMCMGKMKFNPIMLLNSGSGQTVKEIVLCLQTWTWDCSLSTSRSIWFDNSLEKFRSYDKRR